MKLGVLYSGGKDSNYAAYLASKEHEITCLISIVSENPDSYMFHTPNIRLTELQSEAMGIPLIAVRTKGEKESELNDLREAVRKAKELFKIKGIVTGAIASVYQAARIQKICNELDLWCFNPLWQTDQGQLLSDLIDEGFEVIITGVSAYPFDKTWLGRRIDMNAKKELMKLKEKFQINPAGEGGEIETTVLGSPMFKKRISVKRSVIEFSGNSGVFHIKEAELL